MKCSPLWGWFVLNKQRWLHSCWKNIQIMSNQLLERDFNAIKKHRNLFMKCLLVVIKGIRFRNDEGFKYMLKYMVHYIYGHHLYQVGQLKLSGATQCSSFHSFSTLLWLKSLFGIITQLPACFKCKSVTNWRLTLKPTGRWPEKAFPDFNYSVLIIPFEYYLKTLCGHVKHIVSTAQQENQTGSYNRHVVYDIYIIHAAVSQHYESSNVFGQFVHWSNNICDDCDDFHDDLHSQAAIHPSIQLPSTGLQWVSSQSQETQGTRLKVFRTGCQSSIQHILTLSHTLWAI